MKRYITVSMICGALLGGAAALASARTHGLPADVDPVLANQKVDQQLHRVLNGLLEEERAQHPLRWAGN